MSRSGYSDDCDGWALIRWRGAVASAIRGKRGQSFLQEMLTALDALPAKRLVTEDLVTQDGEVCAIGSVMVRRGIDATKIDPYDREKVAHVMGISDALGAEIMYINDDCFAKTPEERFNIVRGWVASHLHQQPEASRGEE